MQRSLIGIGQLPEPGAELIPVSGDVAVLEVVFPDSARHSIQVMDAGAHVLSIGYPWREANVRSTRHGMLLETQLDPICRVPHWAFGRIGEHDVQCGALSPA